MIVPHEALRRKYLPRLGKAIRSFCGSSLPPKNHHPSQSLSLKPFSIPRGPMCPAIKFRIRRRPSRGRSQYWRRCNPSPPSSCPIESMRCPQKSAPVVSGAFWRSAFNFAPQYILIPSPLARDPSAFRYGICDLSFWDPLQYGRHTLSK